ncbi:hypothetical protein SUGI_0780030 [Cryptomeria japonica]|nr:hypothetical protein SUGI_0780030 [Cryptomeria japonica]
MWLEDMMKWAFYPMKRSLSSSHFDHFNRDWREEETMAENRCIAPDILQCEKYKFVGEKPIWSLMDEWACIICGRGTVLLVSFVSSQRSEILPFAFIQDQGNS